MLKRMPSRSILIIEDDVSIRETLKAFLEYEGYSVSVAADGQQGLNLLAQSKKPDLILLDLMMPIMNGWQFLEALAKSPKKTLTPPVLVLTAFTEKGQGLGAIAVIKKPIDLEFLLKNIKEYCGEPLGRNGSAT